MGALIDDEALGSAAICFESKICHKIKMVSPGDFGKNAIDVDLSLLIIEILSFVSSVVYPSHRNWPRDNNLLLSSAK